MEDKLDLPENKLRDFIQGTDKAKWRANNNHNIKYFAEDEIKRITGNYSTTLGNGAFGEVYKGVLDDNREVAVKRYNRMDSEEEFAKEVIVHSQINHKNVVRLIGCCIEKNAPMMVSEYASNGTLGDNLHGSNTLISLDTRLSIAIQCAEALWCMHSMYNPVLHGDIKPSNILLDENFHAKISDFGISRLLAGDNTQRTRNVIGSFGYMDPVFYKEGRLTTKSDVYSLGVVLLELITGKKAIDGEFNLVKSFTQASAKGKGVRKLFDANIADDSNMKILEGIGKLAKDCLEEDIDKRPEMNDVAGRLRELRTTLRQGQPKTGWQFFSGTQTTLKVDRQHDTGNVGSSSVLYKMKSLGLGIFSSNVSKFEKNGGLIIQHVNNLMIFTSKEIIKITRKFSTILGRGSFGNVYMGILDNHTRVVVKSFIEVNESQTEEFINGILVHSRLIHKNIIKLIGCCLESNIPMMVYEFASNGSLHGILHGNSNHKLRFPLDLRLDIAIGSAQGLAYIHSASGTMPHGSIKPANILMDDNFVPKVSDYGQTRLLHIEGFIPIDYTDPVFIKTGVFTCKSDVYSFGVVLLELITRKQARYDGDFRLITDFTRVFGATKSGRAMFDNEIVVEEDIVILEEIGTLAMKCLHLDVAERPEMREVAEQLMILKRARGQGKGGGDITDIDQ